MQVFWESSLGEGAAAGNGGATKPGAGAGVMEKLDFVTAKYKERRFLAAGGGAPGGGGGGDAGAGAGSSSSALHRRVLGGDLAGACRLLCAGGAVTSPLLHIAAALGNVRLDMVLPAARPLGLEMLASLLAPWA